MPLYTIFILLISQSVFSQSLHIFDIDTTDFPTMRAKFYAFDENGEQVTPNLNDIKIFENDEERQVLSVDCPAKNEVTNLSSVLVIDVSGSMNGGNLELAKAGARAYVNLLNSDSELAVTAFSGSNFLVQDFTSDRTLLNSKINSLSAGGGTSFDAALFNEKAGGLKIIQNRTNKKSIILLTDGQSGLSNKQEIIDEANRIGCSIHVITINMACPSVLKDVANGTGGLFFEYVKDTKKIEETYQFLYLITSKIQECEISWLSAVNCYSGLVELKSLWKDTEIINEYRKSFSSTADLEIIPKFVYFKNPEIGIKIDTTITIKAINLDLNLLDIINKNSNALFSIEPQIFPMSLNQGVEYQFTLSFTPTDSNMNYVYFDFETDMCKKSMSSIGGYIDKPFASPTLKLTHPNGGEVFIAGSDTVITWEGITEDDNVRLELSTDNGSSWEVINNFTKGLEYNWKVPKISSEDCLVKVTQLGEGRKKGEAPGIDWERTYGGTGADNLMFIKKLGHNEYFAGANLYSKIGDLTSEYGYGDLCIFQFDMFGNKLRKFVFGGEATQYPSDIIKYDNGYYIFGSTYSETGEFISNNGQQDFWLIKTDFDFNIIWHKLYGGSSYELSKKILLNDDNSIVLLGETYSRNGIGRSKSDRPSLLIVKLDENGNVIWNHTYGGTRSEFAISILKTEDGGYYIHGNTDSNDGDVTNDVIDFIKIWLVKLNSEGELEWEKTIGGTRSDYGTCMIKTFDGNYLISGSTMSEEIIGQPNPDYLYYGVLFKIDKYGNILWNKVYKISENDDDGFSQIIETKNNDIIVSGGAKDINTDFWTMKLDFEGNVIWQNTFGGSSEEGANSIIITEDDGIILGGSTDSDDGDISYQRGVSDIWLVKLTPDGIPLQKDSSDAVFSIVMPETGANDIDMGECLVGEAKDSVVNEFVLNTGTYKYNVDSVYFDGGDADAFELISGIPKYEVAANSDAYGEFRFIPNRIGQHSAIIVIITQVDTLYKNITGIGVEPSLEIINNFIDFGAIYVGESKDTTDVFTIKNVSNSPIEITNIYHSFPNDRDFTTLAGNGVLSLGPNEEHPMDLRFTASEVGLTNGTLLFEYDGVGSPAMVQLYGEGLFAGTSYAEFSGIKISGYPGDVVEFPIILTFEEDLNKTRAKSLRFDLYFNPTLLHPVDYEPIIYSHYEAKIELEITDFDIDLDEIVKYVRFDVGLGNSPKCDIILENPTVDDENLDVTFQNGEFELLGICYKGGERLVNPSWYVSIVYMSPNPAENSLEIMLNLIEEGKTELAIYSTSGDKVKVIFNEEIANTGEQIVNADISDLPSGTYIVVLVTPTYSERKNLIIQR